MPENDHCVTYEAVPPGFDLLKANPDELDFYGIPQRPDANAQPGLFEFWKKLVSPPFYSRPPTFSSIATPTKEALKKLAKDSAARRPKLASMQETPRGGEVEWKWNWSGAVVPAPSAKRIVFATAGWVAPNVSSPSAAALFTHADVPKSLVWVGLDGLNGRLPKISLAQIGTGHWLGGPHFAWWDWWRNSPEFSPESLLLKSLRKSSRESSLKSSPEFSPKAVTLIDDFPIAAGDEILAGLAVLASEDVLFFIKNQNPKSGEFRSFLAKRAPLRDIELLGSSSVEWVVERPTEPTSGKFYPLAAYDPVDFTYCLAVAADTPHAPGRLMTLADNGRMIKMREAFSKPYRTVDVSRAERRQDPDGSIGVTCTFHEPTSADELGRKARRSRQKTSP